MSWLFSRVLVEEYLGENCLDGEQSAPLSGSNTQQAYCAPDKMTGFSRLSQFGMTYKPLMENLGEELLMSYQAAFLARTSQPLEKEKESQENDQVCGRTWQESLARYDHDMSLWRTRQSSLLEDSQLSLETFPKWGSMRNGELWAQTTPTYLTEENEFGSWLPTPTANMWKGATRKRFYKSEDYRGSKTVEWIRTTLDCDLYLNPDYAENLMSFPAKWTELKPLETHKYQSWRQWHGMSLEKDLRDKP